MRNDMDDETLRLYGYVICSSYRTKVLLSLQEKPKFPSQIAKDMNHDLNSISNILTQLRKKGIIKLVNPEVRKGRIYRLTEVGEEIAQNL